MFDIAASPQIPHSTDFSCDWRHITTRSIEPLRRGRSSRMLGSVEDIPMQDVICQAIREKRLLIVLYKNLERVVEPYLLFENKGGGLVLHSWQVQGEYEKTPPPDWCNMSLSDISSVTPLNQTFEQPHPDYNAESSRFYRVICCI